MRSCCHQGSWLSAPSPSWTKHSPEESAHLPLLLQTLLSEPAFAAALQDGSYFADSLDVALRDAQDFLSLVQQPWQTVVVCVEGCVGQTCVMGACLWSPVLCARSWHGVWQCWLHKRRQKTSKLTVFSISSCCTK
jgi:hypothetical protein